jgi:hypothetical protein
LTFFLGCNKPQDLEKGKRSWILAINGWVSREAAKKDWYLHSTFWHFAARWLEYEQVPSNALILAS